jgi:hypothetical protein
MGEIYEVGHLDRLRYHDIHTKFYKDWFRNSKVGGIHTYKYRQYEDLISVFLFFQNNGSRLNIHPT